jgi:amidase
MVANHTDRLDRIDELGENLAGNIRAGLAQSPETVARAEVARARVMDRMVAALETFDAILTPCVPIPAFAVGARPPESIGGKPLETYIDWLAPTFVVSLCSVPAASVPAGLGADGMPVGLQIIGRRLDEARVLGLAAAIAERNPIGRPPG